MSDGVVKSSKKKPQGKITTASQVKGLSNASDLMKKKKKRVYSEAELGIPQLNMITPIGVQKPKGVKKGKVFVDDRVRFPRIVVRNLDWQSQCSQI